MYATQNIFFSVYGVLHLHCCDLHKSTEKQEDF